MQLTKKNYSFILLIFTLIVIILGLLIRLNLALDLGVPGGDFDIRFRAVESLLSGDNPYDYTVQSYIDIENNPLEKGYAYLPGIMYLNSINYTFHTALFDSPIYNKPQHLAFFNQFFGLIANIFICLFFIKMFRNKNDLAMLFCVAIWMFNPYFVVYQRVSVYDVVPVALIIWALYYLEKDAVKSSVLFSLSVVFKTFPIILIFIFLFKTKSKIKFLLTGLIIFLVTSLPFMKSINDFITYLRGALFVHGDRVVQGRPFLFFARYHLHLEFIETIPFKFYSLGSIIFSWLASLGLIFTSFKTTTDTYISEMFKDKYVLSSAAFLVFYFFTPVLNRTYLLWGMPILLLGFYKILGKKYVYIFYSLFVFAWLFLTWYYLQWDYGFHIRNPY